MEDKVDVALPATKLWLQIQEHQEQFWKWFVSDYLGHFQKGASGKTPMEVDLLVINLSTHPLHWKLAQVLQTYSDPKGINRQVRLQAAGKENLFRAVHQTLPLLPEEEEEIDKLESNSVHVVPL